MRKRIYQAAYDRAFETLMASGEDRNAQSIAETAHKAALLAVEMEYQKDPRTWRLRHEATVRPASGERALKITEGALTMISGTHGLKRKQRLLRRAMRKLKRWGEEPADAVVMPMPPILSPPVEDVGHPARITRDTARAEAAGGVRAGLICCAPKGTRSQRSWPRPSGPRRSCASPPTIRFAGGAGGARGELID